MPENSPNAIRRRPWAPVLAGALVALGTASPAQDADGPTALPELPPREALAPPTFARGANPGAATIAVRLGHGRILTLDQELESGPNGQATIAVGDPSVLDFTPLSGRQIRLLGTRLGSTDLSIRTADGKILDYEVEVLADLDALRGRVLQTFPDAEIRLSQVGDHIVIEGEARSATQAAQIVRLVQTAVPTGANVTGGRVDQVAPPGAAPGPADAMAVPSAMEPPQPAGLTGTLRVLSLLRVPGSQQVLLKVRVAELNRTAFRQIGANVLGINGREGSIFGTQIAGPVAGSATAAGQGKAGGLVGTVTGALTSTTTVFGIFQNSNFDVLIDALRRNSVLKILAEPNVVALNGHRASFLAGGEFPVPVPQVAASGVASTITVNFKKFGVQLDFLPIIIDGDTIRLTVDPEVSSIDFTVGTTLVAGGTPVPGLNTRNAHTTVELKQGQTLAIAGLMQLTLDGQTSRIPGLGDLPILGPFFSNTTSQRVEKELVVLVTPYLVEPLNSNQVPPGPGDEVDGPNDLEFYFLNRIEGRTGRDFRATTDGADPLRIGRLLKLERKYVKGPVGFSQ